MSKSLQSIITIIRSQHKHYQQHSWLAVSTQADSRHATSDSAAATPPCRPQPKLLIDLIVASSGEYSNVLWNTTIVSQLGSIDVYPLFISDQKGYWNFLFLMLYLFSCFMISRLSLLPQGVFILLFIVVDKLRSLYSLLLNYLLLIVKSGFLSKRRIILLGLRVSFIIGTIY